MEQKKINNKEEMASLFKILYFFMIIAVIGSCIYLIFFVKWNSYQCLIDPIDYYFKQTNQICYCNNGTGWLRP